MRVGAALITWLGLIAAMSMGGNVSMFVNVPSAIIVLFVGFGAVLFGHHGRGLELLMRAAFGEVEHHEAREAAEIAQTAHRGFVGAGWIGFLIGGVQMLANLSDPSAIGPAVAVALLTVFYGQVFATMIWMPTQHRMLSQVTVGPEDLAFR